MIRPRVQSDRCQRLLGPAGKPEDVLVVRGVHQDGQTSERDDLRKDLQVRRRGLWKRDVVEVAYPADTFIQRQTLQLFVEDDGRHHRLRQVGTLGRDMRGDHTQRQEQVDLIVGEQATHRRFDPGQGPIRLDELRGRHAGVEVVAQQREDLLAKELQQGAVPVGRSVGDDPDRHARLRRLLRCGSGGARRS